MTIRARIIPITLLTALAFLTLPAEAQRAPQPLAKFFASPIAFDNPICSQAQPCTPQGAVMACQSQWMPLCAVFLAPGVYIDPGIDVYHYKFIQFFGNINFTNGTLACNDSTSVVLRANTNNTVILRGQDHATVSASCLTMDSAPGVVGVTAISTRNFVIADFMRIIFGALPNGLHVSLTYQSVSYCIVDATVVGGGGLRTWVDGSSELVMACTVH